MGDAALPRQGAPPCFLEIGKEAWARMRQTKQFKETKARFAEASKRLAAQYPGAECALEWRTNAPDPADDGWRLLIMGRLSAQCTDARVNIVCRELFVFQ